MICWCIFEHMKSKKLTLAIVGCGWLGLPLALKALESGQKVKGSTTSHSKVEELEKMGLSHICFDCLTMDLFHPH
jgi:UDP-N-acetyl-D-mannosaminuronate dehydrogenase